MAAAGTSYWILARSCNYDHAAIASYGLYLLLGVWLPGHCLLAWLRDEPVSLGRSLALGLPLGFAYEIGVYTASSAAGFRGAYPWLAFAGTLGLLATGVFRHGWRGMAPAITAPRPATPLILSAVILLVMMTAAARMHAPSPLADGSLLHSTHHDWVYLLSRGMEISLRWPWQDPSLAGTPLSYHYFFMTHAAAAANTTGIELPLVLFRLAQVPLAVALMMQAFVLGRLAGGSVAAGLLAAVLLFGAGEVSWRESTSGGWFGSLFVEWLYVSPTFFFGMIFMGALLLWVHRVVSADRMKVSEALVLVVLAVAATGAKGTAAVPVIWAATLWGFLRLLRTRQWPWRLTWLAGLMTFGFLFSFTLVLRAWSGDGTAVSPLEFSRITAFWQEHAGDWQQALQLAGFSVKWSAGLAQAACAGVIFAGSTGILLLGLVHWVRERRTPAVAWLGLVAVTCLVSGQVLFLESHAEIYLYLPARLPLAALTGAALVMFWRRWDQRCRELDPTHGHKCRIAVTGAALLFIGALWQQDVIDKWLAAGAALTVWLVMSSASMAPAGRLAVGPTAKGEVAGLLRRWSPAIALVVVAAVQFNYELLGSRSGLRLWWAHAAAGREPGLMELDEALGWIRRETPVEAIVLSTLFVPSRVDPAYLSVADRTTLDKHYYFSSLGGRRMWVEGPAYLRDYPEAVRRMQMTEDLMRTGDAGPLLAEVPGPCYLIVDKKGLISEPAPIAGARLVFSNPRASIHELSAPD